MSALGDGHLPYTRARMMAGSIATMPDHIFLYMSAAITLIVVILSLLTPRPSSERQRSRER
jgi:hypothetical protein